MRLVLLALLALPAIANAAPVVAVLATVVVGTITVGQILLMVGMFIYGTAQQRKQEKKLRAEAAAQRDAYNAGLQDRTINAIGTDDPYTYVYGRARVGASFKAMFTSGARDEYKHLVCVHAAHECDGFEDIYINGKKLAPLDANGWVTGAPFYNLVTTAVTEKFPDSPFTLSGEVEPGSLRVVGRVENFDVGGGSSSRTFGYNLVGRNVTVGYPSKATTRMVTCTYQKVIRTPYVNIQKHLGLPNDPADAFLMSRVPSKWKPSSVVRGFTYTVLTLHLDEPEFQGGIPQYEVVLRGKKLYNFRTGVTAWSQNNAEVTYDYMTSEICGIDSADLPIDQFITAANVCDEAQTFGPRYTFNGSITSDMDKSTTLERMAMSMAGGIVSTTWDIWAGKYIAPVMALSQQDIVGSFAITPGLSDSAVYNVVNGQYVSDETTYVPTDFPPYINPVYVEVDGRELPTDIDFGFTDKVQRVHNLCRIFTEDQRNGYTIKGDFSRKAWALKIGQRVTMDSTVFGWAAKVFRVTDKRSSPTSAVELTLKEDAESIWDFADAVLPDSTPNTNLPDPFAIAPIQSLICQSGSEHLLARDGTIISRILASWPQATTQAVLANGTIEIEWQNIESDVWNATILKGSDVQAYLAPVEDGSFYNVRARCVNPSLNVKSDWTYAELHQVVGKTEKPADIQNLSISGSALSWVPNTELDLKGYIFRFHYGNSLDWNSAVPLHEGVVTQSPFDLVTRPNGVVTIMGKAIDTSGNTSNATANIITNLGDPAIANIVEVVDFHADGFPGKKTNCTVDVDGDLAADPLDSFYGTDNQSAYGLDSDSFYKEESYAQLIFVTNEVPLLSVLRGALITLEVQYEGVDLFIEYRLTQPWPAYGIDSEPAYGADSEPFYEGEPGAWMPWPGQIVAAADVYQWRLTIGAGKTQALISALNVILDAPDIVEYLEDVPISDAGTVAPYTGNFRVIKTVSPTLQANSSGAETVEVDKSINLAPVIRAFNASHVAVSGATVDIILKGY